MGQPKWLIGTSFLFIVVGMICYQLQGQWLGDEFNYYTKTMNAGFSFSGALYAVKAFWQCLTWNFPFLMSGVGAYVRIIPLSIISIALIVEFSIIMARLVIPWAR